MFSLLNRVLDRLSPLSRRAPASRPIRRSSLFLEVLEDRLSPATSVWTGAGAAAGLANPNPNWSNCLNWAGNVAPSPGDTLSFPAAARSLVSIDDYAPGTTFNAVNISGSGYQISSLPGDTVDLQGGLFATNTSGTNTVAIPLTLSAAQTFSDLNPGATLCLSGAVNNGGNPLTINAGGNFEYKGPSISGSGGLTVEGGVKFTLANTASNTYTGLTTVLGVTLFLDAPGVIAIPGKLTIGTASGLNQADVVRLDGDNEIAGTSAVSVNASGLLDLDGYTNTIASLTMQGGYVTTGAGTLTLTGGVTTLPSPSSAVIATIGGATAENNGTLVLGTGAFTVASGTAGVDLNVLLNVVGPGVQLIKQGAGTMQLAGNNTFAGATVSAGTLKADSVNALGTAGSTVESGAVLEYLNPNANTIFTFASEPLTLDGGVLEGSDGAAAAATVVVPGQITLAADSTISAASGTTLELPGPITGPGGFTMNWAGEVVLNCANNYNGLTQVHNGVLALDNIFALGAAGAKVAGQGTLMLQNGLTYATEPLTLLGDGGSDGALFSNGSAAWTGPINLTGNTDINVATGGLLTISGPISGPAANSLTIGDTNDQGANGTVMLTSANTCAGPTEVSVGTLAVANADALGSPGGNKTNNGTTVDSGATLLLLNGLTFDPTESLTLAGDGVNGGGALQSGSGNNTWAGTIQLAGTTAIAAGSGTTLTVAGVVSGAAGNNLSLVGAGTVVLAGANTYLGYTLVDSGFLALDNPSALGSWTIGTTVEPGATLQLEGGYTFSQEGMTLNGSGVNGAGALENLSGNNTWTGPIKLGSPTTVTSADGSILKDTVQVSNEGYLLTVNTLANSSIEFATIISGSGGLTKNGPGTLTFSGATGNTYSGPTVVNGGVLTLAKPASVNSITGSGVAINAGGTLNGSGTIAGTGLTVTVNLGGMLFDTGAITGNVINSGLMNPAGPSAVGVLNINGNFTQTAGGVLDMEVASATSFDQLNISGVAMLGGTLNVTLLPGFKAKAGETFPIITYGSYSGAFATVNLPPGMGIVYGPHGVTINVLGG